MVEGPDGAVTIHLGQRERDELDTLARSLSREPSALIAEAVDAYLARHRWHSAEIETGLRQAEAGEFATETEIEAAFASFR